MPLRRGERAVGWFTLAYVAAAAPYALWRGNVEFLFYIAVLAAIAGALLALHRRVALQGATLWCLSVWGLLHLAGGLVPLPGETRVLYNLWLVAERLKFDQVVHAFGFGVTTWVCWQALCRLTGAARPSFGRLALCVAAGMGFGALNEVVEFVATLLVPDTNVGGYRNTGWDLIANLAGSSAAAAWIFLRTKRPAPS